MQPFATASGFTPGQVTRLSGIHMEPVLGGSTQESPQRNPLRKLVHGPCKSMYSSFSSLEDCCDALLQYASWVSEYGLYRSYICVCVYINYIYEYRKRAHIHTCSLDKHIQYVYIYTYICIVYLYIYIYIHIHLYLCGIFQPKRGESLVWFENKPPWPHLSPPQKNPLMHMMAPLTRLSPLLASIIGQRSPQILWVRQCHHH